MIVYTDVVCDIFHSGHVKFFEKIKNNYNNCYLIVGLMSDEEAELYKRKPINNIDDRYVILNSIKHIDKIIKNAEMPITEKFIKDNNIDIVIHGDDITKEAEEYWYAVPINKKIFKKIEYTKNISTTEIIQKCKLST